MITYTESAREWMDSLEPRDRDRLEPVLELFASLIDDPTVDYYKANILILKVKGQPALALSPRKQYLSFYPWSLQAMGLFKTALPRLGKANPGVGCLRFRKPDDLNLETLADVFKQMNEVEHTAGFGF